MAEGYICRRGGTPKLITEIITASQTWIKPSGVTHVFARVFGGGGGGGGARSSYGGGGGGGGHMNFGLLDVSAISSVAVTVGIGGGGGALNTNGGAGGVTSFGTLLAASGGSGGGSITGDGGSGGTGGGGARYATSPFKGGNATYGGGGGGAGINFDSNTDTGNTGGSGGIFGGGGGGGQDRSEQHGLHLRGEVPGRSRGDGWDPIDRGHDDACPISHTSMKSYAPVTLVAPSAQTGMPDRAQLPSAWTLAMVSCTCCRAGSPPCAACASACR